jgi:hypothetical protein
MLKSATVPNRRRSCRVGRSPANARFGLRDGGICGDRERPIHVADRCSDEMQYDTRLGEVCESTCADEIIGGVNRYVAQKSFYDYDHDRNPGASGTKLGIKQFRQGVVQDERVKKAFKC